MLSKGAQDEAAEVERSRIGEAVLVSQVKTFELYA